MKDDSRTAQYTKKMVMISGTFSLINPFFKHLYTLVFIVKNKRNCLYPHGVWLTLKTIKNIHNS